ncbi:MAG: TonB family protein [Mesorhizobium sp.]|nr:TonB family protein [Mesorhizobium sp.]MBL8579585.1 TonB family protein [Mesorhizobium sp.]
MALGVEPVFASGGPAWPLAGMPAGFEPDDPDLDIPHGAVRNGVREAPERHFPVQRDHAVTHTATEPLAPTKPLAKGGKWNLAIVASCIFHAAIAGFFLYAVDEAVLTEGADFSGIAYLGSGEDQIKAGETSEDVDDAVDVTMVTMLQAKPVETVDAEAVPVVDAAEPMETVEAVTGEAETLQPVSEPPVQQVAEATSEPVTTERTQAASAEPQQTAQAEITTAEPVENRPAPAVTEQVPEVLATDRVELVEDDNVVQKPAEVQAAEPVEAAEPAQAQPTEKISEIQEEAATVAAAQPTETEVVEAVTAGSASSTPADAQATEAVQAERSEAPTTETVESPEVETTDVSQAEPNETEVVEPEAVETPQEAPRPEAKPQQVAEAKPTEQPAERKASRQEQPKDAPKKEAAAQKPDKKVPEGKKAAEKAEPKKTRSGNGGQSQANTRRGQADGQEKGDSKQASKGGSKNGEVGNAAVSNYPGKVVAKLRRAMRKIPKRTLSKAQNDLQVAFTVNAAGGVSGVRIARSSGSAEVDQAALALVKRAAPFPPIPPEAQRSSWPFAVPLGIFR